MRPSQYAWLLVAGLFAGISHAKKANLDIWDLDEDCTKYPNYAPDATGAAAKPTSYTDETEYIQEAFNDVLDIVEAGQAALEYVLEPRPGSWRHKKEYEKWVRIADSAAAILGIVPSKSNTESSKEGLFGAVFDTINNIVNTLPAEENNPAHGYNRQLVRLKPDAKPMLVCGDWWKWLDPEDDIPYLPSTRVEDFIGLTAKADDDEDNIDIVGAWYKNYRLEFAVKKTTHPFCAPGKKGGSGSVIDSVIFCPDEFTDEYKAMKTPSQIKATKGAIRTGDSINKFRDSLAYTALHESMHWFGGLSDTMPKYNPMGYTVKPFRVGDQPAYTAGGNRLYYLRDGSIKETPAKYSETELRRLGLEPVPTYGVADSYYLARWDPSKAVLSADNLALFCLMMYFDDWNWSKGGKARPAA